MLSEVRIGLRSISSIETNRLVLVPFRSTSLLLSPGRIDTAVVVASQTASKSYLSTHDFLATTRSIGCPPDTESVERVTQAGRSVCHYSTSLSVAVSKVSCCTFSVEGRLLCYMQYVVRSSCAVSRGECPSWMFRISYDSGYGPFRILTHTSKMSGLSV